MNRLLEVYATGLNEYQFTNIFYKVAARQGDRVTYM